MPSRGGGLRAARQGFTIVELLIVVVVIAILAAITIVAYNGIQNRARDSSLSTAASQSGRKMLAYAPLNSDQFPIESSFRSDISLPADTPRATYNYYVNDARNGFCLSVADTTASPVVAYAVTQSGQTVPGRCVKNLAIDPGAATLNASGAGAAWNTSRWAGTSPASVGYVTGVAASGLPTPTLTSYIRKTWSVAPAAIANSGDTGFDNGPPSGLTVVSGQSITISCYVRPSVNRNFEIGVYQYASPGVAFSTARRASPLSYGPASQWTRISYVYTTPAGVTSVRLVCDSNANTSNGAVNWASTSTLDGTGLMVTDGPVLYSYGDGNTPGWSWVGTPNNSASFGPTKPL